MIDKQRILAGIEQWKATGYGIDPNQIALRHYPDDPDCECCDCADTEIEGTLPPAQYRHLI